MGTGAHPQERNLVQVQPERLAPEVFTFKSNYFPMSSLLMESYCCQATVTHWKYL